MFAEVDVRGVGKVCVIGQTISTQLFPEGSPVGQILRILRNQPFKVVGVLSVKGLSARTGSGRSRNRTVYERHEAGRQTDDVAVDQCAGLQS